MKIIKQTILYSVIGYTVVWAWFKWVMPVHHYSTRDALSHYRLISGRATVTCSGGALKGQLIEIANATIMSINSDHITIRVWYGRSCVTGERLESGPDESGKGDIVFFITERNPRSDCFLMRSFNDLTPNSRPFLVSKDPKWFRSVNDLLKGLPYLLDPHSAVSRWILQYYGKGCVSGDRISLEYSVYVEGSPTYFEGQTYPCYGSPGRYMKGWCTTWKEHDEATEYLEFERVN
jgi:hypothetical protein